MRRGGGVRCRCCVGGRRPNAFGEESCAHCFLSRLCLGFIQLCTTFCTCVCVNLPPAPTVSLAFTSFLYFHPLEFREVCGEGLSGTDGVPFARADTVLSVVLYYSLSNFLFRFYLAMCEALHPCAPLTLFFVWLCKLFPFSPGGTRECAKGVGRGRV